MLAIIVHGAAKPPPAGLLQAVWIAASVLVTVSVAGLALVAILWGIYRLRRAELDAQGTEVVGELKGPRRQRPPRRLLIPAARLDQGPARAACLVKLAVGYPTPVHGQLLGQR
jgi:hypothetical protein